MTKLYKKNEITFAILWIVAYVVLSSLADQISETVGVIKSVTAALHKTVSQHAAEIDPVFLDQEQ